MTFTILFLAKSSIMFIFGGLVSQNFVGIHKALDWSSILAIMRIALCELHVGIQSLMAKPGIQSSVLINLHVHVYSPQSYGCRIHNSKYDGSLIHSPQVPVLAIKPRISTLYCTTFTLAKFLLWPDHVSCSKDASVF